MSGRFISWTLALTIIFGLSACETSEGAAEPPAPDPVVAPTETPSPPPALTTVNVPLIPGLSRYIKDEKAAVVLGKAMFWDQQVGSDGLACASCHFHAGADSRIKNQINPGQRRVQPDLKFDLGGPNYQAALSDFPFHKLADPDDRDSQASTVNDVFSSQGSFSGVWEESPGNAQDDACNRLHDSGNYHDGVFHVMDVGTRRVEPRNTPTVINAAFNFRNFWDGRGNNTFNGVDPFGLRNGGARVFRSSGKGVKAEQVTLRNTSLGSQAVGPVLSDIEMICSGRSFADFGRKLIPRYPLAVQKVLPSDSVLGKHANSDLGLHTTYENLIKQAFKDRYWDAEGLIDGEYTQMELNFSLFWGLALQLYQSTLVSDDAPYDRWANGDSAALSDDAQRGLEVFMNEGKCINCHKGPEFSGAASALQAEVQAGGLVERMLMNDDGVALYDNGFYNIGVTPTNDDLGVGAEDPFGNPLSFAVQYQQSKLVDKFSVDPCTFEVPFDTVDCTLIPPRGQLKKARVAVAGAFKTPGLRNIELTGPYFHNGGSATLDQVIDFYNRGGNFRNDELDPDITELGLSAQQKSDLKSFLLSLTDARVEEEKAPFDHPQLFIPNGHSEDHLSVTGGEFGEDFIGLVEWLELPAVGRDGRSAHGLENLQTFEDVLDNGGLSLAAVQPFDPDNHPPTMPTEGNRVNIVGDGIAERFSARDDDGNRLTYSASGLPTGLNLTRSGHLSGTLSEAGTFMVTLMVTDGQLDSSSSTSFKWAVK